MSEVRRMQKTYYPAMFELGAYAFNFDHQDDRQSRFNWLAEYSWNYGCFSDEGKLTSQVVATPFRINLFGKAMGMAGVGFVSSYPEYRGQGGINKIMRQLLQDLRKERIELSYLAPFSYPFYRRYGYELVFERIEYRLPTRDWPATCKTEGRIRRCTWKEAKGMIHDVYHQLPVAKRGGLIRESWWEDYKFAMKPGAQFALYFNEFGSCEGYLVYRSEAPIFRIEEWGYLSKEAFTALAGFVGSHNGAFAEFVYETGYSGNDLGYLLDHPVAQKQLKPEMMARIVDIQAFIENYPFKAGSILRFVLEVKPDEYAEWNTGFYDVQIGAAGKAHVEKLDMNVQPDMVGDIQALTQLFMSYRSLEELCFFEKLRATPVMSALADRIVAQPPVLEDYF